MNLTKKERVFLHSLVKKHLADFEEEGETVIHHPSPDFLVAEEEYDTFLKDLLKKLQ